MRRALLLIGAGVLIVAAGLALYSPPAAVILLGLATAGVGLIIIDIKGPE